MELKFNFDKPLTARDDIDYADIMNGDELNILSIALEGDYMRDERGELIPDWRTHLTDENNEELRDDAGKPIVNPNYGLPVRHAKPSIRRLTPVLWIYCRKEQDITYEEFLDIPRADLIPVAQAFTKMVVNMVEGEVKRLKQVNKPAPRKRRSRVNPVNE